MTKIYLAPVNRKEKFCPHFQAKLILFMFSLCIRIPLTCHSQDIANTSFRRNEYLDEKNLVALISLALNIIFKAPLPSLYNL